MWWYGHPGGFGYGYGMMGAGLGWFFMLLVVVIVVAVAVGLLRDVWSLRHDRHLRSRAALDILDERYARGEIDADDYKKRRADLSR